MKNMDHTGVRRPRQQRSGKAGRFQSPVQAISTTDRIVIVGTIVFLTLCLVGGGASRISDLSLLLLRPYAVGLIGLLVALVPHATFKPYRVPIGLLVLFGLTMAIQLVPLPSGAWAHLPLSNLYAPALADTGMNELWRPISIAPDLTVNSMLSLVVPLAGLLGVAALHRYHRRDLLTYVVLGIAFSAFLGLAQVAAGADSSLYLWQDRSEAVADGLFANRNHQAAFIACGLALLGAWIIRPDHRHQDKGLSGLRLIAGIVLAILFLVTVVATGSRTGTGLALAAAGYSYWIVIRSPAMARWRNDLPRPTRLAIRWGWLVAPLLLAIMALAGRAVTLDRLASADALADQRVRSLPVMTEMVGRAFPFGSGYGTFDPFFRTFEPTRLLHYGYFNHAHNDLLELLIVGGLPAAIMIVLAMTWWTVSIVRLHRRSAVAWPQVLGRSAAISTGLIVLASLADYPARTPLIACLLAVLSVWMTDGMPGSSQADVRV